MVSFGALLGANTRFLIYQKLKNINLSNYISVLIINTFSSFCFGFFLSFFSRFSSLNFYDKILLFFSIGFLGSLSTFSSFAFHLFELSLEFKFPRLIKLFIFSIASGIIAFGFGFFLGNQ